MLSTILRAVTLATVFALASAAAHADWPASVQVMGPGAYVTNGLLLPDGSSGGVVSLVGSTRQAHYPYRMNRVMPSGERAPGWTTAGLDVGEYQDAQLHFAPDGAGGLWSAWGWAQVPGEPLLDRHGADGSYSGPYQVTTADRSSRHAVVADGAGGTIVGWSPMSSDPRLRLKRMQPTGSVQTGWPAAGLQLPCYPTATPSLYSDGAGGVLVLGSRSTDFAGCLWRVNGSAAFPAGWTSVGVVLAASSGFEPVALLPSGAGHVFACWSDGAQTRVQRVGLDGAIDPGWPAGGLEVPNGSRLVTDGSGGLFVLSQSGTTANLRHVLAAGADDPAYGSGGINPLDAGAALSTWRLGITCAAGSAGGPIVLWRDERTGSPQVRVRWLLADGTSDPNELAEGRVVAGVEPGQVPLVLDARGDDAGGAFLLWSRDTTGYDPNLLNFSWSAFVLRVEPGALLGVPPRSTAALALSAGPNPARGTLAARFTLPDERPARLELLDLSGRRVRALEASGAGEHAARFDDLGALPPGIYLLRLAHGGVVRVARVALVR